MNADEALLSLLKQSGLVPDSSPSADEVKKAIDKVNKEKKEVSYNLLCECGHCDQVKTLPITNEAYEEIHRQFFGKFSGRVRVVRYDHFNNIKKSLIVGGYKGVVLAYEVGKWLAVGFNPQNKEDE